MWKGLQNHAGVGIPNLGQTVRARTRDLGSIVAECDCLNVPLVVKDFMIGGSIGQRPTLAAPNRVAPFGLVFLD